MGGRWRNGIGRLVLGLVIAAPVCLAEDKRETSKERIPGSTVEFTLVKLPAGKVTIKAEGGTDKTYDVKSLWIGQTEVTWPEFNIFFLCMDLPEKTRAVERAKLVAARSRPSSPPESPQRNWGTDGMPAQGMFCIEAKHYCDWLTKMTGHHYRLPTEAEWQYACTAGGPERFDKAKLKEVAWFDSNSEQQAQPVGKKKPNAWGLYDMLGNVAEWVTMMDGGEAAAGGSWDDGAEDVHAGARARFTPAWQRDDPQIPKGHSWMSNGGHVGFRVVRED